ncbi:MULTISPECIES: hypothetical protein [Legionella]|uniref:Uncharacterized protein n=1 Tax=Legionella drozanskii LLAP-1 TaxID=1212489 RepID=A0A0W0SLJ5_9GAMM|nr:MULTISPECIES: hypothetical protein [Legionella]KTC84256.1 hypothetical protein Ldro_3062 [Legionella drozanskii LLAP-1]PJE07193.1 MAG: hypothetical protein CK430_14325 [Legionella sp.]
MEIKGRLPGIHINEAEWTTQEKEAQFEDWLASRSKLRKAELAIFDAIMIIENKISALGKDRINGKAFNFFTGQDKEKKAIDAKIHCLKDLKDELFNHYVQISARHSNHFYTLGSPSSPFEAEEFLAEQVNEISALFTSHDCVLGIDEETGEKILDIQFGINALINQAMDYFGTEYFGRLKSGSRNALEAAQNKITQSF